MVLRAQESLFLERHIDRLSRIDMHTSVTNTQTDTQTALCQDMRNNSPYLAVALSLVLAM